jgi:hypothetical protein
MPAKSCWWDNDIVEIFFSTVLPKTSAKPWLNMQPDDNSRELVSPQQPQCDQPSESRADTTAKGPCNELLHQRNQLYTGAHTSLYTHLRDRRISVYKLEKSHPHHLPLFNRHRSA